MHSHGISYHGQRTRPWIGGAAMPSPPPPSKYLAPFLSWFSRRKTLVHSIQEGQAASVGEEVSDLAPFGSGQFAQASLDLGLCPATIIELPIGPEQLEGAAATVPGRFQAFHRFERLNRLRPGSTGGPSRTRTPRVDSLLFVALNLSVAGLGLLPKRLHCTPRLCQHSLSLLTRMEEIQPMSQSGRQGIAFAPQLGRLLDGSCNPFGSIGDHELEILKRSQLLLPRLGLAVVGVVTKDRGH